MTALMRSFTASFSLQPSYIAARQTNPDWYAPISQADGHLVNKIGAAVTEKCTCQNDVFTFAAVSMILIQFQ